MADFETIGFVGLGVMGEPMCGHIAEKLDARVLAHDLDQAPMRRLEAKGVEPGTSVAELAAEADLVLLSLPGTSQVEAVCLGDGGLLSGARPGLLVADLSTCAVAAARRIATALGERGIRFCDAPVARTAQAARDGTLSIMVGGPLEEFIRLEPVLRATATDVTHAGEVGMGQAAKILNNMICFQTAVAVAEALTMARRIGMDQDTLYDILSKGSADSFVLRHHGRKAMWPGSFPPNTYSTLYALKDADYALELARDTAVDARGAELARTLLQETADLGYGEDYYPALVKAVDDASS